jgi:plastocyanin
MNRPGLRQRWLHVTAPLAIAVALLSLVSVGFSAPKTSAQGTQAVTISGFAFSPAALTIEAGTTVTWTNQDSATHTATADDGSFDTGNIAQGQSVSITFDTPGTFAYHCAIHPYMVASITVTEAGGQPAPTEAPAQPTEAPAAPTQAPTGMPATGAGTTGGGGSTNEVLLVAVFAAILLGSIAVQRRRSANGR